MGWTEKTSKELRKMVAMKRGKSKPSPLVGGVGEGFEGKGSEFISCVDGAESMTAVPRQWAVSCTSAMLGYPFP
jgi:hypothetical protein